MIGSNLQLVSFVLLAGLMRLLLCWDALEFDLLSISWIVTGDGAMKTGSECNRVILLIT